jgi:hypothetical protein
LNMVTIGGARSRAGVVDRQQTANLGVRSSNLFGRANIINDLR